MNTTGHELSSNNLAASATEARRPFQMFPNLQVVYQEINIVIIIPNFLLSFEPHLPTLTHTWQACRFSFLTLNIVRLLLTLEITLNALMSVVTILVYFSSRNIEFSARDSHDCEYDYLGIICSAYRVGY